MTLPRGEGIDLIIDDTRIAKRGQKMFGVSKIWDHKQQRYVHGHIVVSAAILFRGVTLPWWFDLWLSKRWAGRSYRKTTEIAAAMILAFAPPAGLKVRVLLDAFYLCPLVTNTCARGVLRGFRWPRRSELSTETKAANASSSTWSADCSSAKADACGCVVPEAGLTCESLRPMVG